MRDFTKELNDLKRDSITTDDIIKVSEATDAKVLKAYALIRQAETSACPKCIKTTVKQMIEGGKRESGYVYGLNANGVGISYASSNYHLYELNAEEKEKLLCDKAWLQSMLAYFTEKNNKRGINFFTDMIDINDSVVKMHVYNEMNRAVDIAIPNLPFNLYVKDNMGSITSKEFHAISIRIFKSYRDTVVFAEDTAHGSNDMRRYVTAVDSSVVGTVSHDYIEVRKEDDRIYDRVYMHQMLELLNDARVREANKDLFCYDEKTLLEAAENVCDKFAVLDLLNGVKK